MIVPAKIPVPANWWDDDGSIEPVTEEIHVSTDDGAVYIEGRYCLSIRLNDLLYAIGESARAANREAGVNPRPARRRG